MPFSAPGETASFTGDKTITGSLTVTGGINGLPGGYVDVRTYGAVGDGVTDDTAAIQAAIDAIPEGGPVHFPAGIFKVTDTLDLQPMTQLRGSGFNRYGATSDLGLGRDGTRIDATGIGNAILLSAPTNNRGITISDLHLYGPGGDVTTSTAFQVQYGGALLMDHVYIEGFGRQLDFLYTQGITLRDVFCTTCALQCLRLHGCGFAYISGGNYANAIQGNIVLSGDTTNVIIDVTIIDEGGGLALYPGNVYFQECHAVIFRCPMLYTSRFSDSLRIGAASSDISIYDTHLLPFALDRVPLSCIRIDAGATGVRLINVTTEPNGAADDIIDNGTDTVWINVNGRTKHPVVATADLPAGAALEDGRILIEDGGVGDRNLVFYVGGERYQVVGVPVAIGLTLGPLAIPVTPTALGITGGVGSGVVTGLVSYWKLEEASGTRNDSHGTNHLTDNNTVTSTTGKVGTAAEFTAANSESLSVPNNAGLQAGDIDFTVAAWVYFTSVTGEQPLVMKWANSGGGYFSWALDMYSGQFHFLVSNDGVTLTTDLPAGSPTTGVWYFVVAWHDATANTINLQVDNATAASVAHSGGAYAGTADFHLGCNSTSGAYLSGRLDEVGYWTRILSATERTNIFNSSSGVTYPFAGVP